jgi:hypothetical protein
MPFRKRPIQPTLDAGARPPRPKTTYLGKGGGRPQGPKRHRASDESRKIVGNMCSYGLDVLDVSRLSGLSTSTLYRHYKHELQTAALQKDLMVLQGAFLKCIGGPEQNWEKADGQMQRWWIASRQRWQPPAGRQINANFHMDLTRLSDQELEQLERIMEAAAMDDRGRAQIAGATIEPEDGD